MGLWLSESPEWFTEPCGVRTNTPVSCVPHLGGPLPSAWPRLDSGSWHGSPELALCPYARGMWVS